jgi:hypothetical protein
VLNVISMNDLACENIRVISSVVACIRTCKRRTFKRDRLHACV